jgi:hypothetical protein
MVDVLWKEEREQVAINLELSLERFGEYGFALLCGYAMESLFKQTERLEEVCRHHTHVVPSSDGAAELSKRDLLN